MCSPHGSTRATFTEMDYEMCAGTYRISVSLLTDRPSLQTIDGIAKTVFTLSISLVSLSFGAQIASKITPYLPALPSPSCVARYTLTVLSVLMYASTIVTYIFLPPKFRHEATAALMFSYPGTLTRYLLSLSLNPRIRTIPLGTFTANILGTGLLGGFWILGRSPSPVSITACALLQGLGDGYCGCLTTVSTFAAEVATLKLWKAWVYVAVSWITAQLLLLTIIGPAFFGGHVEHQVTCTFYK
jgi:CrcB protein